MNSLMKSNGNVIPSLQSLMNDFFADSWLHAPLSSWRSPGTTLPAANIRETNDDYKIEIAAPGMNRDNFKIEIENHMLTVSYDREDQNNETKETDYTYREFDYHAFQRTFTLPEQKIDSEKIEARYVDGILYIAVPKNENAKVKPVRQIAIS